MCCVIWQELQLLIYLCRTIMTGFLGHKCNFCKFSAFYMVFPLCLNFNFYGSCDLLLWLEYSLEVVWGGRVEILGIALVGCLYCHFEI